MNNANPENAKTLQTFPMSSEESLLLNLAMAELMGCGEDMLKKNKNFDEKGMN